MLNSIWLRQPYGFSPLYAQEVNTYLNASARVFDSAQQVCDAMSSGLRYSRALWQQISSNVAVLLRRSTAL